MGVISKLPFQILRSASGLRRISAHFVGGFLKHSHNAKCDLAMASQPSLVSVVYASCPSKHEEQTITQALQKQQHKSEFKLVPYIRAAPSPISAPLPPAPYPPDSQEFPYSLNDYFKHLTSKRYGQVLLHSNLVSSTQTLLKDVLPPTEDGTLCWAVQQTAGKGRGHNVWESPLGCLLFSYKCQILNPQRLAFLQYLVSLALVRAIKELDGCENIPVTLKWPNDIYCGKDVKIGGVLCQSNMFRDVFDVTIGVGLNVSNGAPTTCLDDMRNKVAGKTCPPLSMGTLLARFMSNFEAALASFTKEGWAPFAQEYQERWIHKDQVVSVADVDKTPRKVKIIGISNETGYLKALSMEDTTTIYELHPDGHSLDFFNGLIIHKKLR